MSDPKTTHDKAPTIRDVAKLAQVSVATVSRVLNGTAKVSQKARDAVLNAQRELGFYLNANARALAQKDSEIIGVLVSEVSDPYFGAMVRACEELAHEQGKALLVAQGFHDPVREQRAIENLISHQCSGLVIHALAIPDRVLARYMQDFPYMVIINRILSGFEDRCVNINNFHGMYLAVSTLIKNGHRKIAFINSSHHIVDASERLAGYLCALRDNNLDVDERIIVSDLPLLEGGSRAAKKLLKYRGQFTAVASYNDALAASCMATFINAGIQVPQEVSFVGFDNLFLSSCLNPALSTVTNPVSDMGASATRLSLALYKQDYSYKLPEFLTILINRKSIRNLNLSLK